MFFKIGEGGTFEICSEIKVQPDMIELSPPDNFIPEEMHDWKYLNGEFVHDPEPKPDPMPSPMERITALEEKLAAYAAAYEEGVNEA